MTDQTYDQKSNETDVTQAYDSLCRTFESFKAENEIRIAEIERRGAVDPLTEEKLARIDRTLDELSLKARRPALGGAAQPAMAENREHKAAFDAYVRSGEAGNLKRLEAKSLSSGSGPDGGYLVPMNAEREILRRMSMASPIRAISTVRPISTNAFKKAYSAVGLAAGWVSETAPGTTQTQQLADMTFPTFELFAQPAATQTLLDDASVNIESWLADEVEIAFAEQEGAAFVNGDGIDKPKGFLAVPQVANSAWSWGSLGVVNTGAAGAFAASNPSDALIDLVYALKSGYRQNASFVMNRKTQSTLRKFKDSAGHYLWQPPSTTGAQATLMNFPVVEAEDMPDIAADSCSIAFGDFRRGYLVVDRTGIRILRDPYSSKPYVLFYTTKRVGGGVQDFGAIKLLKFAA